MFNKIFLVRFFALVIVFLSCKEQVVDPIFYGQISGILQDAESSDPIANALITTNPSTSSITSDNNGEFSIKDLEIGEYSLIVEKDGYSKKTITVNVEKNKTTSAIVLLNEKSSGVNNPPTIPAIIFPVDGAENQKTSLSLSWFSTDFDGDTLHYDVYLFSSFNNQKQIVADNIKDTVVALENLVYGATYFWQVVVKDNSNEDVNGKVWSFSTEEFPNNPIIFSSNINGNFEIYSAGPDSTDQKIIQITNSYSNEFWPRFNPTRNLVAFINDTDIENHIYTLSLDGTDIYKVTQVPVAGLHNNGMGMCWSPDGNSIFYANYEKLYKISKEGSNLTQIAIAPEGRNFREIDVSTDGDKLVALTIGQNFYDSEIYLMNSDGTNLTKIVENLPGAVQNPIFSLDGKSILYTHDTSEHMSTTNRQLDSRIYMMSLDSLEVQDLSTGKISGTNDNNPRFSNNGGNIIFENVSNDDSSEGEILIMDINGNNRRSIKVTGRMPDWK